MVVDKDVSVAAVSVAASHPPPAALPAGPWRWPLSCTCTFSDPGALSPHAAGALALFMPAAATTCTLGETRAPRRELRDFGLSVVQAVPAIEISRLTRLLN